MEIQLVGQGGEFLVKRGVGRVGKKVDIEITKEDKRF